MTPTAFRRAGVLRYAALQFLVLVPAAMLLYAGGSYWNPAAPGYGFAHNFLSDLGMTHAWSGRANYASAAVFLVALATVGVALVLFAWTWRQFAFAHGRARVAGSASTVLGTASGIAFTGIACTPFDLALQWHNTFVFSAFALLLGSSCWTRCSAFARLAPRAPRCWSSRSRSASASVAARMRSSAELTLKPYGAISIAASRPRKNPDA